MRRRGPRDGWNGLTLKIFRAIIDSGGSSTGELAHMFGITKRAVRYHIRKLAVIGLVERAPSTPKTYPYSIIVPSTDRLASCTSEVLELEEDGRGRWVILAVYAVIVRCLLEGRFLRTSDLAGMLNRSRRTVRRYLARLVENGLLVRTGGRCCRFSYLVPAPTPILEHRHRYTRRHRYRFTGHLRDTTIGSTQIKHPRSRVKNIS